MGSLTGVARVNLWWARLGSISSLRVGEEGLNEYVRWAGLDQ